MHNVMMQLFAMNGKCASTQLLKRWQTKSRFFYSKTCAPSNTQIQIGLDFSYSYEGSIAQCGVMLNLWPKKKQYENEKLKWSENCLKQPKIDPNWSKYTQFHIHWLIMTQN